jgi:hypothetical protein
MDTRILAVHPYSGRTCLKLLASAARPTWICLFILALIDRGSRTPYELQKATGLSQGATIPALQRSLGAA